MILKAIINEELYTLNVPDPILHRADDYFQRLDRDMNQGWQMSRDWVQSPTDLERCQIAADKLLTALETENHKLGMLMAGYILHKLPGVDTVEIDVQGEIQNTEFTFRDQPAEDAASTPIRPETLGMEPGDEDPEAREQAERDVTRVFKVGKGYRFSVFDHASGEWQNSPAFAAEAEAERNRHKAFKARYDAVRGGD